MESFRDLYREYCNHKIRISKGNRWYKQLIDFHKSLNFYGLLAILIFYGLILWLALYPYTTSIYIRDLNEELYKIMNILYFILVAIFLGILIYLYESDINSLKNRIFRSECLEKNEEDRSTNRELYICCSTLFLEELISSYGYDVDVKTLDLLIKTSEKEQKHDNLFDDFKFLTGGMASIAAFFLSYSLNKVMSDIYDESGSMGLLRIVVLVVVFLLISFIGFTLMYSEFKKICRKHDYYSDLIYELNLLKLKY